MRLYLCFLSPLPQQLLHGRCTQITLAYCAPNPYSYEGMLGVLESMAETLPGFNVKTEVIEERTGQRAGGTLCTVTWARDACLG